MSQLWLSVGTPHPEGGTELPGGQGWALGYSTALSMIWKCVKSSVLTLRCWDKQMEKPDLCCSGLGPCAQELMQPHSQGEIMGHRDTSGCSVLGRGAVGPQRGWQSLGTCTSSQVKVNIARAAGNPSPGCAQHPALVAQGCWETEEKLGIWL